MKAPRRAAWTVVTALLIAIVIVAPSAWSDTVDGLNTFSPGETARASEVNNNFATIEDAVDGNDALIAALRARIEELESDIGVPGSQGDQGPQGEPGPAGEVATGAPLLAFLSSDYFDGDLGVCAAEAD